MTRVFRCVGFQPRFLTARPKAALRCPDRTDANTPARWRPERFGQWRGFGCQVGSGSGRGGGRRSGRASRCRGRDARAGRRRRGMWPRTLGTAPCARARCRG